MQLYGAVVCFLLEVIAIDDELLGALFGAENVHHLAKADHMNRDQPCAAAAHIWHFWQDQLLGFHTPYTYTQMTVLLCLLA